MVLREIIKNILNLLVVRLLEQFFSLKSIKHSSTFYRNTETEYESCSEQITEAYLEVDNTNPTIPWQRMYRKTGIVQRKCYSDRKYVPLKARTKTMADLKKDDVSKRREITEGYLKQYEKKQTENRIEN